MNESIRLLVVGAGSIGERHIRAFAKFPGIRISVVESREERRREVAGRNPRAAFFRSLDDVSIEGHDAALIATPADSHVPIGLRCAAGSLHLLVEKPIAVEEAQARMLVEDCRARGLTLAVGYTLRAHPVYRKAREVIESGELGELVSVQAEVCHWIATSRPDYRSTYFASAAAGGGVILDLSHELNYVQALTGRLKLEHSTARSVAALGVDTEAIADLQLSTAAGVPVHIHLHAADAHLRRNCWCAGTKASSHLDFLGNTVTLKPVMGASSNWTFTEDRDDWHVEQARDFLRAIRGGARPACSGEEALETLALCREALSRAGIAGTSR